MTSNAPKVISQSLCETSGSGVFHMYGPILESLRSGIYQFLFYLVAMMESVLPHNTDFNQNEKPAMHQTIDCPMETRNPQHTTQKVHSTPPRDKLSKKDAGNYYRRDSCINIYTSHCSSARPSIRSRPLQSSSKGNKETSCGYSLGTK